MKLINRIQLCECSLIETVNDLLKHISQIEHWRNRSVWKFFVNLFTQLTTYTYLLEKVSLDLESKGNLALPYPIRE